MESRIRANDFLKSLDANPNPWSRLKSGQTSTNKIAQCESYWVSIEENKTGNDKSLVSSQQCSRISQQSFKRGWNRFGHCVDF